MLELNMNAAESQKLEIVNSAFAFVIVAWGGVQLWKENIADAGIAQLQAAPLLRRGTLICATALCVRSVLAAILLAREHTLPCSAASTCRVEAIARDAFQLGSLAVFSCFLSILVHRLLSMQRSSSARVCSDAAVSVATVVNIILAALHVAATVIACIVCPLFNQMTGMFYHNGARIAHTVFLVSLALWHNFLAWRQYDAGQMPAKLAAFCRLCYFFSIRTCQD